MSNRLIEKNSPDLGLYCLLRLSADDSQQNLSLASGFQIRGVKGISALIFWNSALKFKLKGENTLCSLRFQCWYSIYVVKSFILSKKKLVNISLVH